MAFDASSLQYVEDDQWRILTSIEMGMRNHELVATELIQSISRIKTSIYHLLAELARQRLVSHEGKPYDGYSLTKKGYDFLALHTLVKRGTIAHLGGILGQGKEADVYVAYAEDQTPVVIKFHRIGRVSFRKAKDTRDYLSKKHSSSWLYLSRLSAQREFQNMSALQDFPVPKAIDWNRHAVVMSLIPGTLLNNISEMTDPSGIFDKCIDLAVRLLKIGVVHADFSQYNIIVDEQGNVTLIDFPQCMKASNPDSEEKFNHDLKELERFFDLRFNLKIESLPQFSEFVDEIVPRDLSVPTKSSGEEEEELNEEEDNTDAKIQDKVSRENRYKPKIRRKKESKTMSKLKREAKLWQ